MLLTIFSVVGIFFNVRSSMEKPEEMKDVFRLNIIIGVILALVLGFTAYFAIGSTLSNNILLDLPMSEN
jgi:amino acid permease